MTDLNTTVDNYLSIWNETEQDRRRKLIEELFADDCEYVDPLATVSGREGIETVVAAAQDHAAGLTFTRGSTYDAHHNIARFTWELIPQHGAEPVAIGFDVVALDDHGRIKAVYGFLDKLPPS